MRRVLLSVVAAGLLAGCSESLPIPAPEQIERINVRVSSDCSTSYSITDAATIAEIVRAASAHQSGWQTERQMALTTGWFTYPTPLDSVGIRAKNGDTPFVIWFGHGWMGSAVTDQDGRRRYFRKVTAAEVAALRESLGIPSRCNKPPSAAIQR